MRSSSNQRFGDELLPRIVERVLKLYGGKICAEILPPASAEQPPCLRVWAPTRRDAGRYGFPLNITLSWDRMEVDRLFALGGDVRFAEYLDALPGKLDAWQDARQIDFGSRTQADPTVLLGGLDFEHLLR